MISEGVSNGPEESGLGPEEIRVSHLIRFVYIKSFSSFNSTSATTAAKSIVAHKYIVLCTPQIS